MWSTFVWDWEMETGERLLDPATPEAWPQNQLSGPTHPLRPFVGGDCIQQSLLLAIYQARHHLVLTTLFRTGRPWRRRSPRRRRGRAGAVGAAGAQRLPDGQPASNSFAGGSAGGWGRNFYRYDAGLLHQERAGGRRLRPGGTVNLDRRSLWLNSRSPCSSTTRCLSPR